MRVAEVILSKEIILKTGLKNRNGKCVAGQRNSVSEDRVGGEAGKVGWSKAQS